MKIHIVITLLTLDAITASDVHNPQIGLHSNRVRRRASQLDYGKERTTYIKWGSNACDELYILGLTGVAHALYANQQSIAAGSELTCLPSSQTNSNTSNLSTGYQLSPLPFRIDLFDNELNSETYAYLQCAHCVVRSYELITLAGREICPQTTDWGLLYSGFYSIATSSNGATTPGVCVANQGLDYVPISSNQILNSTYGQPIRTGDFHSANKQVPCVVCRYINQADAVGAYSNRFVGNLTVIIGTLILNYVYSSCL